MFKPKCSTFNRPTFTLNHLNIPNVNQSKYLGIVINETNCNPNLKRQMCKLYANILPYGAKETINKFQILHLTMDGECIPKKPI